MDAVRHIRRSRRKAAVSLIGSISFVAIGAYLMVGDRSPFARTPKELAVFWGVVCVALFGAAAVNACLSLLRPGVLTLDAHGYRFSGWFTGPMTRWSEVERFELANNAGTTLIRAKMRSRENADREGIVRRAARTLLDGYNLAGLTIKSKALLETLEGWRSRYGPG